MEITKCDNCGKEIEVKAVYVEFGYGSKFDNMLDGEQWRFDFCCDECFHQWVLKNLGTMSSTKEE